MFKSWTDFGFDVWSSTDSQTFEDIDVLIGKYAILVFTAIFPE